jgi:integrase
MRLRFRRTGFATYSFKARPFSPEFWAEYEACKAGESAPVIEPGQARTIPGTIGDLVARYYRSADWQRPGERTRHSFRLVIDRFREQLADVPVRQFGYEQASAVMAKMADRPEAGNKLRKLLKRVWDEGMRLEQVTVNPWALVRPFRTKGGYHSWTEEEIDRFKACYPVGTRERLALALMLNTAQRRSDAIRLGPQNLKAGRLVFTQRKTGKALDMPVIGELREAMAGFEAGHLCFLVTVQGRPFTDAGFGNWFADACKAAGVPGRAHGLRKAAARRLAEAGASQQEIKAWTGHSSDAEVARYTQAANQARLADSAAGKLANLNPRLAKRKAKPLNRKD